jgi:hypothetical protein
MELLVAPGRAGSSIASLYEMETNFEQVISDLTLASMTSDDEARIRGELAEVIGRGLDWIQLSKKLNPSGKLQTKSIVTSLKAVARALQEIDPTLRGLETGFRQIHEIEVATRIREVLRKNPELTTKADEFLSDFCGRANTISQACLVAAKHVQSTKHKRGNKPIDWYDDFTRVLVFIAGRNNIRTTIVTDRVTGKPKGRFFELAAAFEKLLYPAMRSPTRGALAKRVSRSLTRIKEGQNRSPAGQILST